MTTAAVLGGQIGLVERGGCTFDQKVQVAARAGAVALLVINNQPGVFYGAFETISDRNIPVAGLTRAEGEPLRGAAASGEVQLSHRFEQRIESHKTFNQPWVDVELGGASDHGAFMDSGIPVGGLFTGAGDSKTAEEAEVFGGTAGQGYADNYHRPSDTFGNLSTEALGVNGPAFWYLVALLAQDSSAINGNGTGNAGTPTVPSGFEYTTTS